EDPAAPRTPQSRAQRPLPLRQREEIQILLRQGLSPPRRRRHEAPGIQGGKTALFFQSKLSRDGGNSPTVSDFAPYSPKPVRPTWVIGHKNPDTDAICSALAYADLLRRT